MIPELVTLLQYQNTAVIDYFCHHHPEYSPEQAQVIFTDLLAWMWLNKQRQKFNKNTYLFGPLLILDEMWHCFILHSRDYFDFSLQYFGAYFHHEIEPVGFEHVLEEEELSDFLEDCFAYLHPDWVERRFAPALTLEP
ncbi:hypothetical protein [Legionella shakespearei]|uniref:Uncharacterized protein n=1 Tax=Legionella shakespearei DSM 23087 TaxID=1122169 RepID=A0A0W0Z7L2_9GAMM|nr:hypothetical protein [Legionella shakespearei]KTD65096.1 hypothetical protein Lsha_0465 [Legionella shakespearei DSM 23087]